VKLLLSKLLVIGALLVVSGMNLATAVEGLLGGAIDGLDRGPSVVRAASHPVAYWMTAAVYLLVGVASAALAYRLIRKI
jgi:hypothetical protein